MDHLIRLIVVMCITALVVHWSAKW